MLFPIVNDMALAIPNSPQRCLDQAGDLAHTSDALQATSESQYRSTVRPIPDVEIGTMQLRDERTPMINTELNTSPMLQNLGSEADAIRKRGFHANARLNSTPLRRPLQTSSNQNVSPMRNNVHSDTGSRSCESISSFQRPHDTTPLSRQLNGRVSTIITDPNLTSTVSRTVTTEMLFNKVIEVQHQVLHLTKIVQRSVAGRSSGNDRGSYTLPEGISLPLDTQRAVGELEKKLSDASTYQQMVSQIVN